MPHSKAALVIDTTGKMCAVAIATSTFCDSGLGIKLLASKAIEIGRGHAEAMPTMVSACFQDAKLTPVDIGSVICTTGPGTFNGVRVGLSFARAFALGRTIPAIGITNLQAIAASAGSLLPDEKFGDVTVLCDVKRGELCFQTFTASGQAANDPTTASANEISSEHLANVICGDGVILLDETLSNTRHVVEAPNEISLEVLAELGFNQMRAAEFIPKKPAPFYARTADAKVQSGFAVERSEG